jgi:prepilin peptidase CpaA
MMAQAGTAVGLAVLLVVLVHSAVSDILAFRIRNEVLAFGALAFLPAAFSIDMPAADIVAAIAASLAVLAAGFVLFALGVIGGGDAKLAALVVLWCGSGQAISFLSNSAVLGGLLALLLLAARRLLRGHGGDRLRAVASLQEGRREMPYGVALALGGLTVLPHTAWAL